MDHLAAQPTGRHVRNLLKALPNNLNESYSQLLNETPLGSSDRRYLQKALLWLCFAARPLTLHELGEAVVLEDGDTTLDGDSRLRDPAMLVRLAHGIIDYDRPTGVVSLAHSSIRTCLTSTWAQSSAIADFAMTESSAHNAILRDCLTCLLFDDFGIGYGTNRATERFHLRDRFRLATYAADYWTYHILEPDDSEKHLLLRFLATRGDANAGNYGHWLHHAQKGKASLAAVQRSHPLYYASSLGISSLVKAIIQFDASADLSAPGGSKGSSPIHVAGYRMQKDVFRILIEAGARPLAADPGMGRGSRVNAIFYAETNGWSDVLVLIEQMYPGSTGINLADVEANTMGVRLQGEDTQ